MAKTSGGRKLSPRRSGGPWRHKSTTRAGRSRRPLTPPSALAPSVNTASAGGLAGRSKGAAPRGMLPAPCWDRGAGQVPLSWPEGLAAGPLPRRTLRSAAGAVGRRDGPGGDSGAGQAQGRPGAAPPRQAPLQRGTSAQQSGGAAEPPSGRAQGLVSQSPPQSAPSLGAPLTASSCC